jgi:addiction module HigA family antidote
MTLVFDPPIHPGEILREDFMKPLGLSAIGLARALGVPRNRIERIVTEKIGISADTALRLAKHFGTSAEVWTGLWAAYELAVERKALAADLAKIETREMDAA